MVSVVLASVCPRVARFACVGNTDAFGSGARLLEALPRPVCARPLRARPLCPRPRPRPRPFPCRLLSTPVPFFVLLSLFNPAVLEAEPNVNTLATSASTPGVARLGLSAGLCIPVTCAACAAWPSAFIFKGSAVCVTPTASVSAYIFVLNIEQDCKHACTEHRTRTRHGAGCVSTSSLTAACCATKETSVWGVVCMYMFNMELD